MSASRDVRRSPGRGPRRAAIGAGVALRRLIAPLCAVACLALPPLARAAALTMHDDRGRDVVLQAPAQRVVSLLPSLTESVCALGACSRLVGVDRYSNWPAAVASLPKLGGLDDAQIERIVALHPDLVLVSTSARLAERLESLGLRVLALESRNQADVKRALSTLALALGQPQAAQRVWDRVERETREAARRVPVALRGQRVYFEVDPTPFAAGDASFIGQMLRSLGMSNAVAAELGPFPKLNPEYVVRLQPDIVMAAARDLEAMPRRPGWRTLRALQQHRVCPLSDEHYELLVRPGPRLGEAAAVLADCLSAVAAVPAVNP